MDIKIVTALIALGYMPTVNMLQILDWIERSYGVVIEIQYYPSDSFGFSMTEKGGETFSDEVTTYESRRHALNAALEMFLTKFVPEWKISQ